MKYLLLIMLTLVSCTNGKSIQNLKNGGLNLVDAYANHTTGGKESVDGTHSGITYNIVLNKFDNIEIKALWINKTAYKFETFKHEGLLYVSTKVFSNNTDNVIEMKMPVNAKGEAVIMYRKGNENFYLEVLNFEYKESSSGK